MDVIIFGISKISEVVYTYIKDDNSFNVAGFCVDKKYMTGNKKFGLPVVAFEDVEKTFPPDKFKMLVAIGYHMNKGSQINGFRAVKVKAAKEKNYKLVSYVSKNAFISPNVQIGENCIILDNVSLGPFVKIGNNVCIYSNATIAHHSIIEDNVWVTSGTIVGGNSTIGKNTFLGINSTIGHNMKIGEENFIGANALITKCTEDKSVFICPDTKKYRLNTDQFMKLVRFD